MSEAFVTASLLFCVGPLTIVGSIQDGLTGDYEALATKSMLDGFASIALAATLGWGVALAAGTVLVVQGALSLGADAFENVLEGEALDALTSAGGVLIVGISLKLLDLKDVKVGNFLPALVIAPGLVGIVEPLLAGRGRLRSSGSGRSARSPAWQPAPAFRAYPGIWLITHMGSNALERAEVAPESKRGGLPAASLAQGHYPMLHEVRTEVIGSARAGRIGSSPHMR